MEHRAPLLTFLIAVPVLLAAQQFSAEKPIQDPDIIGVEDIAVADLDNDGDLDIVICSASYGAHVGAYFNDGSGAFGPQVKLADANEATELALVDLDEDGDLDVTWANDVGPAVAWCQNLGGGQFLTAASLGIQSGATSLAWGDVDQDGDLDVFTAHYGNGPNLGYSINNGNQVFGPRQAAISLYETFHCAAGDMDGDGDIDGVVAGNSVIWRNNENDGFVGVAPPNGGILDETTGDISNVIIHHGDQPDEVGVFVAETGSDQVRAFGHQGAGVFGAGSVVGTAPGVKDLFVADINGDGQDDLLAACPEDNSVRCFMTMASDYILLSGIGGASRVAAGDFDNDGMCDIVTTAYGGLAVFRQISNISFGPPQALGPVSGAVNDLICADIDGDALPDVVLLLGQAHALYWRKNLGDDNFGEALLIADGLTNQGQILAHDLDGDGDLDLVMGFPDEKLAWYRNNGSGSFTIPLTIASDFGPDDEFAIGDLDGDGDADIAAASGNANVRRFLNTGNGNFDPPVEVAPAAGREILLADVDADGDLDIVLHRGGSGISTYANDGSGSFVPFGNTANSGQTQDMRTGDLDNDGDADLIALSAYGASAFVYLSNGDGTFFPLDTLPVTSSAEIGLADMDGDTDLDLVAATDDQGRMYVLLNDGSGAFPTSLQLGGFLGNATECVIADLDKDGDQDLLGGSLYSMRASWFENFIGSRFRAEGRLFYDLDGSEDWNTGDVAFPYHSVNCVPSASAPYSGPDGVYRFTTDEGAYTISAPSTDPFWTVGTSPSAYTINLTGNDPIADSLDFGYVTAYDTLVLEVASTASPLRCAQPYDRWIDIDNRGTLAADAVVDLFLPLAETVLTTDPAPDEVNGNHYRWYLPTLPVLGHARIVLSGQHGLGTGFNLYDSLHVTATAPGTSAEYDEAHTRLTACSFDPNDKQVSPVGYGAAGAVDISTDRLRYTIRFQNTGTDTAFTVMLRDRLDPRLDRSSIHIIGTSHTLTSLNVEADGEAVFLFHDILLPDSNVNEQASHGYVVFSIGVLPGAPSGTVIDNAAEIFFDVNEPVITNTVMNTLIDCSLYTAEVSFIDNAYLQASEGDAYQWYLNGEAVAGSVQRELFFAQNGSYTVEVTNQYGCFLVSVPYEVFSTGLLETAGLRMAVVPNPIGHVARVVFSAPPPSGAVLSVVDTHGRTVRTERQAAQTFLLHRSGLLPGIYTLHLTAEGQRMSTGRFVVE